MKYINFNTDFIKCIVLDFEDGNTMGIPFDEANSDYQIYLAWLAQGNTPEEYNNGL